MPKKTIPVVYECSDETFAITVVSINSIMENTKQKIDFYLLDCGINFSNKRIITDFCQIKGHSVQFITMDLSLFSDLKGYTAKNFVDCYSRLQIPSLLPDKEKVIYCDSDTIFVGDINDLWSVKLKNKAIAGVHDLAWGNTKLLKNLPADNDFKFVNAGIYVLNCKKWRTDSISDKCFAAAKKYKNYLGAIIEDIFSAVFTNDDVLILPLTFGFSELPDRSRFLGKKHLLPTDYTKIKLSDVIAVHFTGPNKPWRKRYKWNLLDKFELVEDTVHKKQIAFFEDFWNFAQRTPVYAALFSGFVHNCMENTPQKTEYKVFENPKAKAKMQVSLFNFIPLLKCVTKNKTTRYKLFGFIPFLKVKEK